MKLFITSSRRRTVLIGLAAVSALLVAALAYVLANAVIEIPKPSGPHPVGFRSTTLAILSRHMTVRGHAQPRVIMLDTWYPATTTAGLTTEPYQDKALAQLLAKYQNIPDMGGSTNSYAFVGAPVLPGRHPVVIFNHGYSSFTKQNFSNMQELASHGYLVISIGHPGDSLVSKDAQGNMIEFNVETSQYADYKKAQENPKAMAGALSAILAQQRDAGSLAAHRRSSQALAKEQPFAGLQPMLAEWVLDTRAVIDSLDMMPEADTARVTLMGHSFGGLTALEIAKDPLSGVNGVINLDGPWVLYADDSRPLRVPLLALLSTDNMLEGKDIGMHGTFDAALAVGTQPAHVIEIAGAAHNNFSDLNYVQLLKHITPVLGSVDGRDLARWQNEATLTFLRRLEQGGLQQPLLQPDARINQRYFGAR
jgi:dienelactone hydrolase